MIEDEELKNKFQNKRARFYFHLEPSSFVFYKVLLYLILHFK